MTDKLQDRITAYFDRNVAQQAAKSLSDAAEVEIRITTPEEKVLETVTFTKRNGKNTVLPNPAKDPQLVFTVTHQAIEDILADPSEDIGSIGVNIMKMMTKSDANRRVSMKITAGF